VSGDERDETLAIQAVLERDGAFTRAAAGTTSAAQVVAANVDVALLVQALDRPPSPRRVERSLALAWHAAAAPIVVLSKADLCPDPAPACAELSAIAVGAPLLVLSAVTGAGMDALVARLARGRTFVLVGLSGAGKSTLVNALAGSAVLPTGAVREADRRGRHTTTHRQMVRLPCGALAIDTPGVREIGLVDAADGLEEAFADVESLAAHCRFADCAHDTEPDCAVRAAVEAGTLDAARLVSFRRLLREEAYEARRRDAAAQAAEERRWRSLHRALRDHPKYRR
jgi:ribosome biogenesis GTPase